jgi:hypothetical protein
MRPNRIVLVVLLLLLTANAWADERAELDKVLQHPTAPGLGLDRAQVRALPWCGTIHEHQQDWASSVQTNLNSYHESSGLESRLFDSARLLCSAPTDPVALRAAVEIEQLWINETGLAEADALVSLALRADDNAFQAERTRVCEATEPKGSDPHAERTALAAARYSLLGCRLSNPLWMNFDDLEPLTPFVDRGSAERDAFAHLAWVLYRQRKEQEAGEPDAILGYAIDQFDFHAVAADAVLHQLDAAPYRGNRYAHVVVLESIAHAHMVTARLDALVAKRANDGTWKELLLTAPQRGAAAWAAAAGHDKDALAHSDDIDRKMREGGDFKGCQTALRADFLAIVKPLKHDDVHVLNASISDHLLAGLLLQRLSRCMALDGDADAAALIHSNLIPRLRIVTGPRVAAYYATLDAISAQGSPKHAARQDVEEDVPADPKLKYLPALEEYDGVRAGIDDNAQIRGGVAAVDKTAKGMRVTFAKVGTKVMSQSCTETNKIDRIDHDGRITYRQVCHDTGMVTRNDTPDPVVVPAKYASGLHGGGYATFDSLAGGSPLSPQLPLAVYKDRAGKHLVAFYGFPLE